MNLLVCYSMALLGGVDDTMMSQEFPRKWIDFFLAFFTGKSALRGVQNIADVRMSWDAIDDCGSSLYRVMLQEADERLMLEYSVRTQKFTVKCTQDMEYAKYLVTVIILGKE